MKRRLALFSALVVLALGGMAAAHGWLYAARDQMGCRVETEQGDSAALAGISVETLHQYNNQLCWTTRFDADNPAEAETIFSYALVPREEEFPVPEVTPLLRSSALQFSGIYDLEALWETPWDMTYLRDIAAALNADWGSDQPVTTTVRLRDYLTYLPVSLDLFFHDQLQQPSDAVQAAVQETFRVPVPETLLRDVSVGMSGSSAYVEYTPHDGAEADLPSTGLFTDMGVYVALFHSSSDEQDWDFSQFSQGYGVYRFPVTAVSYDPGFYEIQPEPVNFYPLDEDAVSYVKLLESPIPGQILICTREPEGLFLTAVDEATGQSLQQLALTGDQVDGCLYRDGLLLLTTYDMTRLIRTLTVLPVEDNGLTCWLQCPYDGDPIDDEYSAAAFDGQRLALAMGYAQFKLWAFDAEGLLCSGTVVFDACTASPCWPRPIGPDFLTVTLTGEEADP